MNPNKRLSINLFAFGWVFISLSPILWFIENYRLFVFLFTESIIFMVSGIAGYIIFDSEIEVLFDAKGNSVKARRLN